MILSEIGTTVESLPGVGPATAKLFARLNIFTVGQLLQTFPREYDDLTKKNPIAGFANGKVHTVCQVLSHEYFGYGNTRTLKIIITDGNTKAALVCFNRYFLQKQLPVGSIIAITGNFYAKYGEIQSSSFDPPVVLAQEGDINDWQDKNIPGSGIIPTYSLTEGLTQKTFRKTITQALKLYGKAIDNQIPLDIIHQNSLMEKNNAICTVHNPNNLEELSLARKTLIYEEFFTMEYKMALRSIDHRGRIPALEPLTPTEEFFPLEELKKELSPLQTKLLESLPFSLTSGQITAIHEINMDIDKSLKSRNDITLEKDTRPFSMQRLLQGDVGSGKTLAAFFAALRTVNWGGQVAIMAPTELLARQHAENAAKMLSPFGVKVAFLTGNLKSKNRNPLLDSLKQGQINIVIGTHALFSRQVEYANLSLAIIDEQHRFGVAQRESIVAKGRLTAGNKTHNPDLLMMSATPIPQTLALTVFGDLDISIIKSMPQGRIPVKTYLSVMGHEQNVYQAVHKELAAGHQAYFVYPRIGDSQEKDSAKDTDKSLKAAEEMYTYLSTKIFPNYRCALIHGKVEEEDQNQILKDFSKGEIKVLIATTVVEVGVDVPNATAIVIEHADNFGLAELHQLRGRVGRNSLQSYCFLIYGKEITETGKERLKALHSSTDGFYIAEQDLKLRGPGEVWGTEQSGEISLNVADFERDKDILIKARYDAFNYAKKELE